MGTQKPKSYKNVQGVVYSTNSDFKYNHNIEVEPKTLPPQQQNLKIMLDRKLKGGKKATLVTGFVGSSADLSDLTKQLKNLAAAGGSSSDGEMLIQGDCRQKIMDFLVKKGYKVKLAGG